MPSYDFRCKNCGHKFSTRVAIKDKDKVKCDSCDSSQVEQLFTSFAMLKSTGSSGCSAPTGSSFS